jgi:hypothetical protein
MYQKNLLKLAVIGLTAGLFLSAQAAPTAKETAAPKKEVATTAVKKEAVPVEKKDVVAPKKEVATDKETAAPKKEVAMMKIASEPVADAQSCNKVEKKCDTCKKAEPCKKVEPCKTEKKCELCKKCGKPKTDKGCGCTPGENDNLGKARKGAAQEAVGE